MVAALLRWSCICGTQTYLHQPMRLSKGIIHNRVLRGRMYHICKELKITQQIYRQPKDRNFLFTEEVDVTEYLGIKMNRHRYGSM